MIEEADFQKIGNAAIDLCVFVEKLRLGKKHREEANKLTHNVLNLIKQTEKIKEEPLTKGKIMKRLKIQFWKAERALAMQILEQEGLPKEKEGGFVKIDDNAKCNAYLQKVVATITDELFTGKGELKIGEMCEVKDDEDHIWNRRKLLAILPEQYKGRFIVETEDYPNEYSSWDCARPIAKQTKPTIEECGNVITYTWEEK